VESLSKKVTRRAYVDFSVMGRLLLFARDYRLEEVHFMRVTVYRHIHIDKAAGNLRLAMKKALTQFAQSADTTADVAEGGSIPASDRVCQPRAAHHRRRKQHPNLVVVQRCV